MKTPIFLILIIFLITLVSCEENQLPNPNDYTDATTFFEELEYNGSVLISKNGADVLRSGFGQANKETGKANSETTKFRIGSVSKTLTGMGIVQLKRDGLINSFDQLLSDFYDDFPQGSQITISQLLSHKSGIPEYLPLVEQAAKSGQEITAGDIFNTIKTQVAENGLDFTPGTAMAYSNSNFLIAALLIEKLSGESYEEYITENVLQPLNMNDTEMGTNVIPGVGYAQGYRGNTNVSEYPMNIAFGAGCWTSTVNDLGKWCRAAMGNTWFSAEEKKAIFGGEVPEESTSFGLAWFKSKIGGKEFFWHGGDIDGFSSLIGFVPESNGIVIALSNEQDDTGAIRNKIIETILQKEF